MTAYDHHDSAYTFMAEKITLCLGLCYLGGRMVNSKTGKEDPKHIKV